MYSLEKFDVKTVIEIAKGLGLVGIPAVALYIGARQCNLAEKAMEYGYNYKASFDFKNGFDEQVTKSDLDSPKR